MINRNKIVSLVLMVFLIYSVFYHTAEFYRGYHNLDLAQNFLRLGYTQDITSDRELIPLEDIYMIGLDQMETSFFWICFNIIVALLIGYFWSSKDI